MAKGKQKANFSSLAEMFPRKGQHKKTMSKDLTNRFTQENAHDAIELHSHTHEKHTSIHSIQTKIYLTNLLSSCLQRDTS